MVVLELVAPAITETCGNVATFCPHGFRQEDHALQEIQAAVAEAEAVLGYAVMRFRHVPSARVAFHTSSSDAQNCPVPRTIHGLFSTTSPSQTAGQNCPAPLQGLCVRTLHVVLCLSACSSRVQESARLAEEARRRQEVSLTGLLSGRPW